MSTTYYICVEIIFPPPGVGRGRLASNYFFLAIELLSATRTQALGSSLVV
jgi:hypothetical protein